MCSEDHIIAFGTCKTHPTSTDTTYYTTYCTIGYYFTTVFDILSKFDLITSYPILQERQFKIPLGWALDTPSLTWVTL